MEKDYNEKMVAKKALRGYITLRFFSDLLFAVFSTVNLVYQATVVGLNPFQLVLVGALLESTTFIFEVPTGIVADLYSRKLSVLIGVVLVGLGFVLEGSIPVFESVLIAQVIWGFGYTFISGAREAWIADEVGEKNAGAVFIKAGQFAQAGTFIGIALSMALANIDIRIPIIVAGILYAAQAIFIALFMHEYNFVPTPAQKRETFQSMKNVFIKGTELVRKSRVLLVIIATAAIYGVFSEGFDRLWTPFMLQSFTFPAIGNVKPVVWFGIISLAATLLAVVITESFRHKVNSSNHRSTVKALFFVNLLLVVSVAGFALAGNFMVAAALYCGAEAFRRVRQPVFDAWANQNVTSSVRATVLSMCSQADAIGQVVGGPILGLIATVVALKVSLLAAALILTPTLFFYLYSIRNHKLLQASSRAL